MVIRRTHDPIVPGKIITLGNGKVIASPARTSFLASRGLSTAIHQASIDLVNESKSTHLKGEIEPIRRRDREEEDRTYCQSKRRTLRSDLARGKKNFIRVTQEWVKKCEEFEVMDTIHH